MKKLIFTLVISLLLSSCILKHTDDYDNLGDNYYFLPDGRMSHIGFNTAKKGEDRSGTVLIEGKVVNYAFNNNFIIAKSIDAYTKEVNFWIINKKKSLKNNIEKYEDSILLYNEILKRNINLELNTN